MALIKHAPCLFYGRLSGKPCFIGKSFSKTLCHGVDIIGLWKDKNGDRIVRLLVESRMDKEYSVSCRSEFTCHTGEKKFCEYVAEFIVY